MAAVSAGDDGEGDEESGEDDDEEEEEGDEEVDEKDQSESKVKAKPAANRGNTSLIAAALGQKSQHRPMNTIQPSSASAPAASAEEMVVSHPAPAASQV